MDTLPTYIQKIIESNQKDIREVLRQVRESGTPQTIPGKHKVVIMPLPEKKPTE